MIEILNENKHHNSDSIAISHFTTLFQCFDDGFEAVHTRCVFMGLIVPTSHIDHASSTRGEVNISGVVILIDLGVFEAEITINICVE